MLRLTYASVGDIEGVEIWLVGVRFVLWLSPRGHGVVVVVVVREYQEVGQAIAGKSRGREAETLPTRVRSAGDTGAVPCTMRQYWEFEKEKSEPL
jgi:hypothetical protein